MLQLILAEVYRPLQVKPIRTSPYHLQTDGLVERFNRTLKAMLRKTATEDGKDWDRLIPYLLFACREIPQASTGFSPFELLYGRQVRGPPSDTVPSWTSASNDTSYVELNSLDKVPPVQRQTQTTSTNVTHTLS